MLNIKQPIAAFLGLLLLLQIVPSQLFHQHDEKDHAIDVEIENTSHTVLHEGETSSCLLCSFTLLKEIAVGIPTQVYADVAELSSWLAPIVSDPHPTSFNAFSNKAPPVS